MKRHLLIGACLLVATISVAQAEPICIIVNNANKEQLTLKDIKSIYSDNVYTWDNGERITVYNLPPEHPGAEVFARNVLDISAQQAAMSISDRNITNTARNQQQTREELIVAALVARNRNAIGYVSCHLGERPDTHIVARLSNTETAPTQTKKIVATTNPPASESASAPAPTQAIASPMANIVLTGTVAENAALLLQKNPRVLYQATTGLYHYYVGGQFDASYNPRTLILHVAANDDVATPTCEYNTQGRIQSPYEGSETEGMCTKLLQQVVSYLKK